MIRTVLLADGDVTTLELMSAVLIRNGFAVQSTNDGGDALARYMELSPELVICDEDVPGLSVGQLCQQVRGVRADARLVVLCGSEALEDDEDDLCKEYHCDAVLAWPFRFGPLRDLLSLWGLSDEEPVQSDEPSERLSFSVPAPSIPVLAAPGELAVEAPMPSLGEPTRPNDVGAASMPMSVPMPIPIPIPVPEPPLQQEIGLDEEELELDIDAVVTATVVEARGEPKAEPESTVDFEAQAARSTKELEGAVELDLDALSVRTSEDDELGPEIDLEDAIVVAPPVAAAEEVIVDASAPKSGPAAKPVPLPDGVSRSGDLAVTPLPRLVFELYVGTYTGVLRLSRAGVRRAIVFRAGLPIRIDSEQMGETLGFMLRDDGRITAEQLDAAQDAVKSEGGFFGEKLVAVGALRESELLDALRQQTERKLANSFAWRDGIYELEDDINLDKRSVISEVNPLGAIFRGVREHYELGALLDYFSKLRDRYVVTTPGFAVHAKTVAPHLEYFNIEEILDGKTTFEQALRHDDAHSLEVSQALYFLLVTDMVKASTEPGEAASKIELAETPGASSLVDYAALMDASDRIAREYLQIMQSDYFTALELAHDATPETVKEVCDAAVERIRKDVALPGLPHDALRRAREVLETINRARKLLLHSRRRDRYLIKLQRKSSTGEEKKPVDQRRERLIDAERAYKEGVRLLKDGDGDGAYLKLDEAVHTNAAEPTYRVALARAILIKYADRGAKARSLAYTHVEEALRLDSSNLVANLEAARILCGEGQRDLARGHVERVLQRAPHHQGARRLLEELSGT